jgi:hypothetical protein
MDEYGWQGRAGVEEGMLRKPLMASHHMYRVLNWQFSIH